MNATQQPTSSKPTAVNLRGSLPPWKWSCWRQWILINAIGFAAASWGMRFVLSSGGSRPYAGAAFGLLLGLAQFIILRWTLPVRPRWILNSILALTLLSSLPFSLDPTLRRLLGGLAVGFLQWLVLRRHSRGVAWWILASGSSWIAAETLTQWPPLFKWLAFFGQYQGLAHSGLRGLLYGALSGIALVYLIRGVETGKFLPALADNSLGKELFCALWIITNAFGWAIGFGRPGQLAVAWFASATGFALPQIAEKAVLEAFAALIVWPLLWRQGFRGSFWWVLWSGIGAAVGLFAWTASGVEPATGIVVYGAVVAFFQWFVLSQQFRGFWTWLVLRTALWSASLIVVSRIGQRFQPDLGWGAGGLTYGVLIGLWMYWQLRKQPPPLPKA